MPDESRSAVLRGLTIVLTRPRDQAGDFAARIEALGGTPVVAPAIAIAPPEDPGPLDAAISRLGDFDWIAFTSANAVRMVAERARLLGIAPDAFGGVRLAAVGPATATALAEALREPDSIARTATARSLGAELPMREGDRVLVPRANLAGDALAEALRARGAVPHDVLAYRTVAGEGVPGIVAGVERGEIDALLFASGSAARFVAEALDREPAALATGRRPAIFCIGPSTARAAAEVGLAADGVAAFATQPALIDTVVEWFGSRSAGR